MPITVSPDTSDTLNAIPEFIDASDPRGPWRARRDWASGDLYFNAGTHFTTYLAFFFQLTMLSVSFAFAAHLYNEIVDGTYRAGDWGALLPIVVAGFVGIIMSKPGILAIIQGLKWRGSHFHLAAVPVAVGGPLRGELRSSKPIAAGHKVWFKLECVCATEHTMFKSDGTMDHDISYNTVWEDEEAVVSDGSGIIPIAFVIPADARQTRAWSKSSGIPSDKDWSIHLQMGGSQFNERHESRNPPWSIEWRLTAQEDGGGPEGYCGEFELPVFSIPVTAEQKADVESIRAGRTTELEAYKPGPDFKVRITPTGNGGTEYYFPPIRGAANPIIQTVVFLATAGLLVLLCLNGQPSPLYFAVLGAWGFLELGFFNWILRLWFAPEQVVIAGGILSYTFGNFGRTRKMTTAEITSIRVTKGMYTRYYAIRIVGGGMHLFMVGDGIRVKRDAEWLARQMSQAVGVKAADSIPGSSETELAENVQAVSAFVHSSPLAGTFLAQRLDQQVSEIMKIEKGISAGNLSRGVADIQPGAPAPALTEDEQQARADAIASRAFGVPSPRQIQTTGRSRGGKFWGPLITAVAVGLWIYRVMVINGHLHGH